MTECGVCRKGISAGVAEIIGRCAAAVSENSKGVRDILISTLAHKCGAHGAARINE